jgi:hypothetical protein
MIKHLESGECTSWFNRERVDRCVGSAGGTVERKLVNPIYVRVPPRARVLRAAPETSWDGHTQQFHCFRCLCGWPSLSSLNAHLARSRHAWREDLYTCPDDSCGYSFGLFSALVEHLESRSCAGRTSLAGLKALKTARDAIVAEFRAAPGVQGF